MSRLLAEICRGLDSVFDNKRTCHRRGRVAIRVKACDRHRWSLSQFSRNFLATFGLNGTSFPFNTGQYCMTNFIGPWYIDPLSA